MLNNHNLYELSLLNAGVFFIGWIISALCKSPSIKSSQDSNESKTSLDSSSRKNGNKKSEIKEKLISEDANNEEKITENITDNGVKDEEKVADKPMKEGINIPKIVQPIT